MNSQPSNRKIILDFETYSECDLKRYGAYAYAQHPSTEILMCAWLDTEEENPKTRIAVGEENALDIPGILDPEVTKIAHNAEFERFILQARSGVTQPVEAFIDTAAFGALMGFPRPLKHMAIAMGVDEKDEAGTRLINLFSKTQRGGKRNDMATHTNEYIDFINYCIQDVDTTSQMWDKFAKVPLMLTDTERRIHYLSERINAKGIPVDVELAQTCANHVKKIKALDKQRVEELTGLANANSVPQFKAWLGSEGIETDSTDKAHLEAILERDDLKEHVREALELKKNLAIGSLARFQTIADYGSVDGHVHGTMLYAGAHTARWVGKGVQPHNLPKTSYDSDAEVQAAVDKVKRGELLEKTEYKKLLRSTFDGGEHGWIVSDFSAIEARVIAWLAGEQWVLDAFEEGKDIYIETAAQMYGVSYEDAKPLRPKGKIAVLALGYAGGLNALKAFGYQGTDEEGWEQVRTWRRANPNTTRLWEKAEHAFLHGGQAGEFIKVGVFGDRRNVVLPSGRTIVYRGVKVAQVQGRRDITFINQGKTDHTHGGKLIENWTQAVARDLLGEALLRLDDAGYDVRAHVHDEVLVLAREGDSAGDVEAIMGDAPEWAKGLPTDADTYRCKRYRKE